MRWLRATPLVIAAAAGATEGAEGRLRSIDLIFGADLSSRPDFLCILTDTVDHESAPLRDLVGDAGSVADGVWRIRTLDGLGKALEKRETISAAFAALAVQRADRTAQCEREFDVCAPRFRAPLAIEVVEPGGQKAESHAMHVRCRENSQHRSTGEDARTVVVKLSKLTGASPGIRSIRLEGTVATVGLRLAITDRSPVVAAVAGGHYAATPDAIGSGGRIDLPLKPWCRRRRVELAVSGPVVVQLTSDGDTGASAVELSCRAAAQNGSLVLPLPVGSGPTLRKLTVSAAGDTAATQTVVEAAWPEVEPPPVISTRFREVWWRWKRHCLYPAANACPRALLGDAHFDCRSVEGPGGTCTYACKAPEAVGSIPVPGLVRFDGPDGGRWVDYLSFSGQSLDEYVSASERTLTLDFARWGDPPVASSERELTESIELFVPGMGEPLHVPMRSRLGRESVRVPGLQCDSEHGDVEYTLRSRRPAIVRRQAIESGAIEVQRPNDLTLPFLFGLGFWVGYSRPVPYPNFWSSGGAELPFPDNGLFGVEASLRWVPRTNRLFVEFALAYLLGQYEHRTVGAGTLLDGVWYQRYLVSVLVGYQPWNWLGFGLITRGWYGNPLGSENGDFAPTNQFGVRHGLRVELWPNHSGALLWEYTLGWNETVQTVAPASTPRLAGLERRAHGWMLLGYRMNVRGF
jgi:hypothetical protein